MEIGALQPLLLLFALQPATVHSSPSRIFCQKNGIVRIRCSHGEASSLDCKALLTVALSACRDHAFRRQDLLVLTDRWMHHRPKFLAFLILQLEVVNR